MLTNEHLPVDDVEKNLRLSPNGLTALTPAGTRIGPSANSDRAEKGRTAGSVLL